VRIDDVLDVVLQPFADLGVRDVEFAGGQRTARRFAATGAPSAVPPIASS
jgi:hypothetical protein